MRVFTVKVKFKKVTDYVDILAYDAEDAISKAVMFAGFDAVLAVMSADRTEVHYMKASEETL